MSFFMASETKELHENAVMHSFSFSGVKGYVIEPRACIRSDRKSVWFMPAWMILPEEEFVQDGNLGKLEPRYEGQLLEHEFYAKRLLEQGYCLVCAAVGITLGSPIGTIRFQEFYEILTHDFDVDRKVILVGQSNGGIMATNWAVRFPHQVERILYLYPALDMRSWPGLEKAYEMRGGTSMGYDMSYEEFTSRLWQFNPVEQAAALAADGIKILSLHGTADTLVPFETNTLQFYNRYIAAGAGNMSYITLPGIGHGSSAPVYESREALAFLTE